MFIPAFIIGALGSFHCIGMCGPIAMAVPMGRSGDWSGIIRGLSYNVGRVITYAMLGLIVGLVGQRLALGGYQQMLSITIGAIILLAVLMPRSITRKMDPASKVAVWLMRAKSVFGTALRSKSPLGPLGLGLLNGLLPCGMVYVGMAGALAVGKVMESTLFMVAFGLGTLPMMLAVHMAGNLISINLRARIRSLLPYAFAVMGALFILRGMGLGIPYVSPFMGAVVEVGKECR
ncbi:MAG: sulfite exporter TauE/SafE family protein [Flavobacteriales bacterium]|nr:sulfite exporter TauE/SafE family protein [Flavobacteriales bacterium]